MYNSLPPEGTLDPQQPWYNGKISASSPQWDRMKAKLTGGTDASGTSYYSMVHISADEADEIIANMKKDPRGFPQMNMGDQKALYHYQNWIVSEYLESKPKGGTLIDDKNVGKAPKGENVVYKKADKNDVDNIVEKQEEQLEEALTETSDKIMDLIDKFIEEDKKKFEDFKKKQELEVKGKFQYDKPIGPDAMQGPKEPSKETTTSEDDDPWESEVNDQLGKKLDEVLEQVRNEPLPQPTKTNRRKTKGKKPVSKKKPGGKKVGLGGSLEEIQENVTETKNALFEMYKVDKKRFEFRKKIDSQLTTMLKAKKAEADLEKEDDDDDKKKKGFFATIGDELKNGLKAGLTAGLIMMFLPLLTDLLRPFFNRDPETEGENQWWDPLDLIPNPRDVEEEGTDGTTGDEKAQSEETTSPQALTPVAESDDTSDTPVKSTPTSAVESDDTSDTPVKSTPTPADTASAPPMSPLAPVRDTNVPGDSGYQKSTGTGIPFRTAAKGGRFDQGKQAPLKPLTRTQVNLTEIRNKTKPLMAATMLPQKIGTLGLLSIAKSIITPFSSLIPDEGKTFIKNVFRDTASMAGIDGYSIDFGTEESIWDAIKKMIFGDGDGDNPPPPGGGGDPSSPGQAGGAVDANELYKSMGFTKEQWDLYRNTVAQIESGGEYNIAGGSDDYYDGRYQMGAAAKKDGAKFAGVANPGHDEAAREAFRQDPALQEQLMTGYTKANHTYLMRVPEYANATPERKLQILGYAHNQGMGNAEKWMKTGEVGVDGFNTKGTKYTDAIAAEFKKQKQNPGLDQDGKPGVEPAPPPGSALPLQPDNPTSNKSDINPQESFVDKLMRTVESMFPQTQISPAKPKESKLPTLNTKTGTHSNKSSSSRSAAQQPSY